MARDAFLGWQQEGKSRPHASQGTWDSPVYQTPSHLGSLPPAMGMQKPHAHTDTKLCTPTVHSFGSNCLLALRATAPRNRRISEHCTWKALSAEKGKEYPNFKWSCVLDILNSMYIIAMVWYTFGAHRTGIQMRHSGTEIAENTAGFASSAFKSSRKHSISLSLYIFHWI